MQVILRYFVLLIFIFSITGISAQEEGFLFMEPDLNQAEVEIPGIVIQGVPQEVIIHFAEPYTMEWDVQINEVEQRVMISEGKAILSHTFEREGLFRIQSGDVAIDTYINPVPLWLSILPPLIAILMALLFKEVISSLFLGIFVGAAILNYYAIGTWGIFTGFLAVLDTYIINSLNNWDHLAVILFSMLIGAMVVVISKNGGMRGVVNIISRYAKTARSGQLSTFFLGIVVFFDDYANTLVVGNTMRPVTDKLKISREKLSYIVDSTAAPIAAIAFVTTWIGAQLGFIKDSVTAIDGLDESAYSIFINSLQYAFYPVFTLAFMLILILKAKDFGPMLKAEKRARETGALRATTPEDSEELNEELSALEPVKNISPKAYNAIIPVLIVIFGTIAGLLQTGYNPEVWADGTISLFRKLSITIGDANSYKALLWASLSGLAAAILLTIAQGIMSLPATMESMVKGFKTMITAIIILILAWSLALVTQDMHTANYITGLLLSIGLSAEFIPAITFVLAAIVAFSTGSSWGTMAILYPLMLPAAWLLCVEQGLSMDMTLIIFYNVVSTVLAGSVLGDHCSPISDTTILSSLATSCNHIDHVRTQLPYALTVGAVAILAGTVPAGFGISSLITYPIGILLVFLIIHFVGKDSGKEGLKKV
ncbi:MAG: Na+/H+ antiporter NhaC family protein [Bacteroidetes bacterium]|nr:Na+/H+ antiporter NhaC family protein [Bacteroidota bacterium]